MLKKDKNLIIGMYQQIMEKLSKIELKITEYYERKWER